MPLTSASPSPNVALTTLVSGSPEIGSPVKTRAVPLSVRLPATVLIDCDAAAFAASSNTFSEDSG